MSGSQIESAPGVGLAMAGEELNHRQRKHVYMHSSIFDTGGPESGSVYAPKRQQEIYGRVGTNIPPPGHNRPSMNLPRPADMQCTQNAGHDAVLPRSAATSSPTAGSRAPRTTNPEHLVNDGEAMPVVRACKGTQEEHFPKEFWATSVNLQWHDPRNELSRNKAPLADRQYKGAQELKMQELSSEIFGKERMTQTSTPSPHSDLLHCSADPLECDTALDKKVKPQKEQHDTHQRRFVSNLAHSQHNPLGGDEYREHVPAYRGPPVQEDPETMGRRRGEKNFSDMFGAQMGERRETRGNREEITATGNCSFLDSRGEIAARNKNKWRHDESHASARREAEWQSTVLPNDRAAKPEVDPHHKQVHHSERACWDTRHVMDASSEIARRRRMKDFEDESSRTAEHRKWEDLASSQVRQGIGVPPAQQMGRSSPRAPRVYAHDRAERPVSAKDTKLASLQSSIFS